MEYNSVKFRKSFDSANATSIHFRKILLDKCWEKNIDLDNLQREGPATKKMVWFFTDGDSRWRMVLGCWRRGPEGLSRSLYFCHGPWTLLPSLGPRSIVQRKAFLAEKIRLWYEETGEGSFLTQKNAEVFIGQSADSCAVDNFDTYIDRHIQIQIVPESVLEAPEAKSFRICRTNEEFEEWKKNGNANAKIYHLRKNSKSQNILVKSQGVDPLRQLTEKESSSYWSWRRGCTETNDGENRHHQR